ncbi:hypothetical protein SLEP1_g55979 [Rubroshorea leprosula]|uniref:NB-ARC domain-containing protein n=1 Tax=Rubroshorea leprosula TaxID=152421 RepID=A0AAV5MI94_9ROSI|nr:hypothetical protein SLEP1_g55979 [Rubroshorea leprosula]
MENIKSAIDIVKDVGLTVCKYVKYQFCPSEFVDKFEAKQNKLKRQLEDVEAELNTQLNRPAKKARSQVNNWLEETRKETAVKVEDLICKEGYFKNICSSRKFHKKTQALNAIFMEGGNYTNAGQSLVIDDHSIEYCTTVFKEKQEQLKRRHKDIEATLKTQRIKVGKIPRKEVEDWMDKASQQIAIKVEDLISPGERSSSPNLEKKTEELKQTFEQGEKYANAGESLVVDDHSIKGVPLVVDECSGRDDVQDQILEWLKGDEVIRIAVSGMGGVGKTTIMKQVHNQLLKESKFNEVIWVKVSRDFDIFVNQKKEFDVRRFQKRIASSLEPALELKDPENPFSLEDVGIPNLVGNNGCKLVLTTRLQDVARAMECKVIPVNPLPPEEALALFLKKVGSEVLSDGRIKVDIKPFLEQILQKCGGVPLAIVTVAKSMRGKLLPRNWKLALSEFSQFKSIVDCLKFSYECLEPQCQECFLYCALYPEDYEISKKELIEYWIEEGFIYKEGKTREAMNWKGHDIVDKLVDNCLLELVRGGENWVSMHDLLREMALEISPQFLVKAGMALEKLPEEDEWREDLLKVSLMNNHITKIPSSMPSLKCPMLTTLLMSNNRISTIPEAFFEHMLGLKILDISNNRELSRLPTSVSKLEKLTTLLLGHCKSLREVPSLSNLVGLKKLDLSWTSIKELPQGLNTLTNLKYLGLGGRLSETLDEQLQNLSKLQHLQVFANPYAEIDSKWETIGIWGKLQNLEKLQLGYLDNLNMVFGEVGAIAESAPLLAGTFSSLQDISVWGCNKIKMLFSVKWLGYLQKLQIIVVFDCKQLEEIIGSESEGGEKVTLPKLERLELAELPQLKTICSGSLICDSIRKIEISGSENIESVFWSGFNPLPNLEYLKLSCLPKLKYVFDEEGLGLSPLVPPTSFFSLKKIKVIECNQLKKVFSSGWLLRYFQSLQTIEVDNCLQMEELIPSSVDEEEKVTLPKLQRLKLTKLPQLKSICSSSSVSIGDSIQSLTILDCEKLKRIPLNFPLLDNAQSSHPSSLKEIVVWPKECKPEFIFLTLCQVPIVIIIVQIIYQCIEGYSILCSARLFAGFVASIL